MIVQNFSNDRERFPIFFHTISCGFEQTDVYRSNGLTDFYQIMIVKSGKGILECADGRQYKLRKGSAFYLNTKYPHSYISEDSLTTMFVTYWGDFTERLHNSYGKPDYVFYDNVDVDKYSSYLNEISKEYWGNKNQGRLSAMVYSLIVNFFEEESLESESPVENALHYMEKNFASRITLDDLAKLCAMSRSQFCKEFKNYYNCTAFEKLLEIRVAYGYVLTSYHKVKTKDAAVKCGFEDVGYFCRAFKKRYGTSPQKINKM